MINIKKIIFFIITSALTIIVIFALILFFYTTFFYKKPTVEKKITEKHVVKNEESSFTLLKESYETSKDEEEDEFLKIEEGDEDLKTEDGDKNLESKKITEENKALIDTMISDALYATIGDRAITKSDIVNEIKVILILNNQSFTAANKDQLQAAATQSIIKRTIKRIEIAKYKSLAYNPNDLQIEIAKLSSKLNMDTDTLKNTFTANKIDFSQITSQLKVELLWNSLIFNLYKDRLVINYDEINDQLKLIKDKKDIKEYFIAEIIIKPVPMDKLESKVEEIKNKIKEEGFENVAVELSISDTSSKGGNLGWVNENSISEKIKSKIINTPVGNISDPIILPEGILFFKIKDKRNIKIDVNLEDLKKQLVSAEKGKILNMYSLSHYDTLRRTVSIKYF